MGNRRKAREAALQILYQIDLSKMEPLEAWSLYWKNHPSIPEVEEFTRKLVYGFYENRQELDRSIESHSTHWRLSRMACVDRNILRIAVYELIHCSDIPATVSLNEAIEIAKKYGTEDSGSFINGVLDNIAKELNEKNGK